MILENLRDRHPEMFAPKPAPRVKNPRAGEGRLRIARERLERYANGLRALIYNPEILAMAAKRRDLAEQLASTGGYEAPKA